MIEKTLCGMVSALLLFVCAAFGEMPRSGVLELVRKNYCSGGSLDITVNLTVFWSIREKEEKKAGRVQIASGDRFRVTLGNDTYVSDGQSCWTYNKAANQVIIRRLSDMDLSVHPSRIFTKYIGTYPLREVSRKSGVALLAWKNDTATTYRSVEVTADVKSGTVSKTVLKDRSGNIFTYVFSKTVLSKKFKGDEFEFVIPSSARVVDSRK